MDAVPPGQQPTRISPTATDACTGKTFPMAKPSVGMMVYCNATPSATCFGCLTASKKSSSSSVRPMPSMVTARAAVIISPLNQVTNGGLSMPTTAPASTHSGNALVSVVSVAKNPPAKLPAPP